VAGKKKEGYPQAEPASPRAYRLGSLAVKYRAASANAQKLGEQSNLFNVKEVGLEMKLFIQRRHARDRGFHASTHGVLGTDVQILPVS